MVSRDEVGGGAVGDGRRLAQRRERTAMVLAVLKMLLAEQQEMLRLVYFGRRTLGDVAERLQLPLARVKAHVFAGLRRVGHLLDPQDPT